MTISTEDAKRLMQCLQAESMRAMSNEEIARRQLEAAEGMRNVWGRTDDPGACTIPDAPPPTLWARFKRWMLA